MGPGRGRGPKAGWLARDAGFPAAGADPACMGLAGGPAGLVVPEGSPVRPLAVARNWKGAEVAADCEARGLGMGLGRGLAVVEGRQAPDAGGSVADIMVLGAVV